MTKEQVKEEALYWNTMLGHFNIVYQMAIKAKEKFPDSPQAQMIGKLFDPTAEETDDTEAFGIQPSAANLFWGRLHHLAYSSLFKALREDDESRKELHSLHKRITELLTK